MGSYLLTQGSKGEALEQVKKAVKLNPLDYNGYRLLGSVYEFLDNKKESLAAYKKAASLLEVKAKSYDSLLGLAY